MALLRWSPLLLAMLGSGSTCHGSSDRADVKPESSAAPSSEVSIPGVDIAQLTPREKRDWASSVGTLLAPCAETPVPLSQCIKEKRDCKACLPAAQFLLKQVQAGRSKQERDEAYAARFDSKKVRTIVTDGSPEKGSPDAPVTIVEWADFECPACRAFYPLLDQLEARFPNQVRVVYKFYPLSIHPHGELAARAAYAAARQGKFWPMHHILFDNQDKLEQQDLERYAKKLDLDLPKLRADMGHDDTLSRIEKDKKQADGIGLQGTPTIYINGREVELAKLDVTDPYGDLEAWIKLDLELLGITPAPPPPPPPPPSSSASASPTASASASPAASASASSGAAAGPAPKK